MLNFLKWLGFHIHDWTDWTDNGQLVREPNNSPVALSQIRECKCCHIKETRRQWY